jgi:general secretion pathway protein G
MRKRGFTLIEILVAATIIAVLSVVGVASYTSINKRSRDAKRKSDLEQVRSALEMFRVDNGFYPTGTNAVFVKLDVLDPGDGSGPFVSTYMPSIPMDPQNTALSTKSYYYAPLGTGAPFYSYCICATVESEAGSSTCTGVTLPGACKYGLKNP